MNQTTTAPKMNYDQFIATLISNAVTEIERQTGRKVKDLSFPTPRCYDNAENHRSINVTFVEERQ